MSPAGAIFDTTRTYRYVLWRRWRRSGGMVAYIGLNPSTANDSKNDNTITKLVKITENNGYGGFYMLNLFALISTNPDNLLNQAISTIGRRNNAYLHHYASRAKKVVFCWGSFTQAYEPLGDFLSDSRADQVAKMFPERYCLQHNSTGRPKHPLYCLDTQKIIPW
jgi:hypothetical protein